jgi:hypothetical protein
LKWVGLALLACVAAIGGVMLAAYLNPVSTAQRLHYRQECLQWFADEFGDDEEVALGRDWIKRGRLVVMVLLTEPGAATSSIHLCVVDPERGEMLRPGLLSASDWLE